MLFIETNIFNNHKTNVLINIFGMRKSGNHIITFNILNNFNEILYYNDIDNINNINNLKSINISNIDINLQNKFLKIYKKTTECVCLTYEDNYINKIKDNIKNNSIIFKHDEIYNIIIIRNIINVIISRLLLNQKKNVNNTKSFTNIDNIFINKITDYYIIYLQSIYNNSNEYIFLNYDFIYNNEFLNNNDIFYINDDENENENYNVNDNENENENKNNNKLLNNYNYINNIKKQLNNNFKFDNNIVTKYGKTNYLNEKDKQSIQYKYNELNDKNKLLIKNIINNNSELLELNKKIYGNKFINYLTNYILNN